MQKNFTVKLWKVMKICAAQTLIALILCGISIAHSNYAQILDRQITISLTDVPFEEALNRIEKTANVKFAFSTSQLSDEPPVNVQAEQRPLRDLLEEVLEPRNIRYKVHERENTITLKKFNQRPSKGNSSVEVVETGAAVTVRQITGVVMDANSKQPMAGVNIIVKGTTRGTTSDADGNFTIEADDNDVLVFSFIGYKRLEEKVGSRSAIDVRLDADITSLNEVEINAGYYVTTREESTGSISRIKAEEIQKQPVSNFLAAMQGRVPGVEIIQQTGVPGGSFQVRIRGQNSIINGNDPLYIIDGVPFFSTPLSTRETAGQIYMNTPGVSPLSSIDPSEIETIEVLKDADATAIYGSRGANGVVLITTKRGLAGKTSVELGYTYGIGHVSRTMNLMETDNYLRMRKEAFSNDGISPTPANAFDLTLWDSTRNVDWQGELIGGTASYRDAQIAIRGGEGRTQFSFQTGYHSETTVFPGDNQDQRLSTHLSVSTSSANEKFSSTFSLTTGINRSDFIKQDLTGVALVLPPNAPPLYDQTGELNWGPDAWNGVGIYANPLAFTKAYYESKTFTVILNGVLSYQLAPGLVARTNVGLTNTSMKALTGTPLSSVDPAIAAVSQNSSVFSTSTFDNWIVEPQLDWQKSFNNSRLNILAGGSVLEQINDGTVLYGTGFSSESLMKTINAANTITKGASTYRQYRYMAFFGRFNYALHDKYFINLTARRDGSSRFGDDKRYASFGAAGVSWLFTNEEFLRNLTFLSFGKLRVSYGITGNDQIGDYQFLDTYSSNGSGLYQGITGLRPQRLYNAEFGWETVSKFEVALETGLFGDAITSTIGYYKNRSSDQLVGMTLPSTTGFVTIQANTPAIVENTGVELEISSTNIRHPNFSWVTSGNITLPRNKLIAFPGLETSPYASQYVIGEPIDIRKLYRYTGINPQTGIYEFEDYNGDGILNYADRYVVGSHMREYYGGLSNEFRYKNVTIDFLIQFVKQQGRNYILYNNVAPGSQAINAPDFVTDRWQSEGDPAGFQKYSTSPDARFAYTTLQASDRSISDASFVRLKNVALSWNLPESISNKLQAQSIDVRVQCQNLLTFTGYKGIDPETQTTALPPLRIITIGGRLTF